VTAYSIAFLAALALALIATPLVVIFARWVGAVDGAGASSRKIHQTPTPRLGGLAIVVAFYAPLVGLFFVDSYVGSLFAKDTGLALGLLLGGAAITGLGVYDDIFGANAPQKFAVQFAIAAALYAVGFRIELVSIPFAASIEIGFLSPLITCVWIVGIINAVNLIDGLDGLASGIAFLAAATTLVVALVGNQILMALFMACLSGALLGFLVYNFNPARIFMGDTGSMFLGFVLAVTTVQTSTKSQATVALLVPMLALGLPIMDTTLAMGRRLITGRSMFSADRGHLHHRLLDRGLSHRQAVLVLYGISVALCGSALIIVFTNKVALVGGALVSALAVSAVTIRWLFKLPPGTLGEKVERLRETRVHHRSLTASAQKARDTIRSAESLDAAWNALTAACAPLEPSKMRLLSVHVENDATVRRSLLVWSAAESGEATDPGTIALEYPIRGDLDPSLMVVLLWPEHSSRLTDVDLVHLDHVVGTFGERLTTMRKTWVNIDRKPEAMVH